MDHFTRTEKSDNAGDACLCLYEFKKTGQLAMEVRQREAQCPSFPLHLQIHTGQTPSTANGNEGVCLQSETVERFDGLFPMGFAPRFSCTLRLQSCLLPRIVLAPGFAGGTEKAGLPIVIRLGLSILLIDVKRNVIFVWQIRVVDVFQVQIPMDIQVIGVPEFISIFGRENRYWVWVLFLYGDRDGVIAIAQYVNAVFVKQTVIHPFVKENGELLVGRYSVDHSLLKICTISHIVSKGSANFTIPTEASFFRFGIDKNN